MPAGTLTSPCKALAIAFNLAFGPPILSDLPICKSSFTFNLASDFT